MRTNAEYPSFFLHYLATALKKDARTVRRYCEWNLIPEAKKGSGKHWRYPAFAAMNEDERRAFAARVASRVGNFERGSNLNPMRGMKVGQIVWPDKEVDIAYWKLLDVLPGLAAVGASEERDWDPDPDVNYDRDTLEPGPNIAAAQCLWNMQKNVADLQLFAVGNIARKFLRDGINPTVRNLAAELCMCPRSLYEKLGTKRLRDVISAAKQIEGSNLPELQTRADV